MFEVKSVKHIEITKGNWEDKIAYAYTVAVITFANELMKNENGVLKFAEYIDVVLCPMGDNSMVLRKLSHRGS